MPSSTSYDLLTAFQQPGCPVCSLELRAVERYLESLFYESVNDPRLRERLRASLGFCREHAWLAMDKRLGNALGFAIIYHDVINNILRRFESENTPPSSRRTNVLRKIPEQVSATIQKIRYALTPQKHCIACQQRDKVTHILISTLIEDLDQADTVSALRTSDGLCLPHLKLAFEAIRNVEACEVLLSIQREKLESLRAELEEFIRKNDYRFKSEGMGAEGDSWQRAVRRVIGDHPG